MGRWELIAKEQIGVARPTENHTGEVSGVRGLSGLTGFWLKAAQGSPGSEGLRSPIRGPVWGSGWTPGSAETRDAEVLRCPCGAWLGGVEGPGRPGLGESATGGAE